MAKRVIKRIGVLSLAKVYGVVMAVFGLILGVMSGLFMMLMGSLASIGNAPEASGAAAIMGGMGIATVVVLPIAYGALGFVSGALTAWIYNLAAGFSGGLEFDVDDAEPTNLYSSTPPSGYTANEFQSPPPPPRPYTNL